MPHSAEKTLPLSSVRLLTDTTSTPAIFLSAFMWMTPIAPVPARLIFIECGLPRRPDDDPRALGGMILQCQFSSEWRRLLVDQPRRIRHRHRAHLVSGEASVQQPLREHREAFGNRRIDGLAEIGGAHR